MGFAKISNTSSGCLKVLIFLSFFFFFFFFFWGGGGWGWGGGVGGGAVNGKYWTRAYV